MTIEEQCAAALKRLAQSVAISAGLHKRQLRNAAERMRLDALARWNREDYARRPEAFSWLLEARP